MKYLFYFLLVLLTDSAFAQIVKVHCTDAATRLPLQAVSVLVNGKKSAQTDSLGHCTISITGTAKLQLTHVGYRSLQTFITVAHDSAIELELNPAESLLQDVTVIASTRANSAIENSPLKVEVLGQEELNEEATIKPGNIASLLGDVSGVQIQQSSATTGNANVRIQGLEGRYTQILRDGMPIYEGYAGGFGVLTIPPLDLKQIELVKGSASTLYGGGAIAGLINLISKKPAYEQQADAVVNYSTLREFNANTYLSKRNKKLGYSFFTGYTNQQATDVNKDGFSDVPNTKTFLLHPRMFVYPGKYTTLMLGYEGTFDTRKGGDIQVLKNQADVIHQYFESNKSSRNTGEYSCEQSLAGNAKLTIKGSLSSFKLTATNPDAQVRGDQLNYFNEASIYIPVNQSNIVAGVNINGDCYKTDFPDTASFKSLTNHYIGVFGQYHWNITANTILESGLRFDHHNRYGWFALPRVALFQRINEHFASRAGFAMGYKTPNPLSQQIVDYSPLQLLPLAGSVHPEISYGFNAEVNYKIKWDENTLFVNQAFFLTSIDRPVVFNTNSNGKVYLQNADKPVATSGSDTYMQLKLDGWEIYLGYTYTKAVLKYINNTPAFIPLTPRHRLASTVVKEIGEEWRFGLEGSYTGRQYRLDYSQTPAYLFLAAMVQRNLGEHFSIVLNGENLLDYRQSREEALYTGSMTHPQFKPLWAPIDGRVINLALRWKI